MSGLTPEELAVVEAGLGRAPNALELALFEALWSEHCSYKHTKLLLKRLPTRGPGVVAGPGEGAGAVAWRDGRAVVFKLESHNHPSYVAPFDGAATGLGGILRDVFGMGAEIVGAAGAIFADGATAKASGLLDGVIAGLKAYAAAFGVPVGAVLAVDDPAYAQNPLVNVLAVGVVAVDHLARSAAGEDDLVFVYAGRPTDLDGVRGAAFASAAFGAAAPAVRVPKADPEAGKRLYRATLALIAAGWVRAAQDMGAAGLLSASAEMAAKGGRGATLWLDRVPEAFLPAEEKAITPEAAEAMMLSETQERMLFAVRRGDVPAVLAALASHGVPAAAVGEVRSDGRYVLVAGGRVLADVPVALLVDGVPLHDLRARVPGAVLRPPANGPGSAGTADGLPAPGAGLAGSEAAALAASFGSAVERAARSAVRRWFGPGPGPVGAVRLPASEAGRPEGGLLYTVVADPALVARDARRGTAALVVRGALRLALRGARPLGVTNNLNFGDPADPRVARDLVEAIEGLAAGAEALALPVVSGNVSLYNATAGRSIPPSPVVGLVGDAPEAALAGPPPLAPGDVFVWIVPPTDAADPPRDGAAAGRPAPAALRPWIEALGEARLRRLFTAGVPVEGAGPVEAAAELLLLLLGEEERSGRAGPAEARGRSGEAAALPERALVFAAEDGGPFVGGSPLGGLADPLAPENVGAAVVVAAGEAVPALRAAIEAAGGRAAVLARVVAADDPAAEAGIRLSALRAKAAWAVDASVFDETAVDDPATAPERVRPAEGTGPDRGEEAAR
ncbi:MAG: phosphoribosylformylglycinamidine synthase II [Hydrogenibacillus schlegelii]|nr:phosphoribosylformylglycinamidine synthase II [Hydrogenibacillus schlegelii]